jgi:conjugal transfer pilus assembly protein TraK
MLLALLPCMAYGETAPAEVPLAAISASDGAADSLPDYSSSSGITVLPEISQVVELSNRAFNRIRCNEAIQDIVASDEKLLDVKYTENDAFVKFRYAVKEGRAVHATKPLELSIICGGEVFNIVAVPKPLPVSPRINLSSGKKKQIRENAALFSGLALEKKARRFVELAYKDDIPSSFDIAPENRDFRLFKELGVTLGRIVTVPGEGLRLKEFRVQNSTKDRVLRLSEGSFLKAELTSKPVFIVLSRLNLNPSEAARLFIVERTGGDSE